MGEPEPVEEQPPEPVEETPPGLPITFETEDGSEVTKYFTRKPLGLGYEHKKGAPVNRVGEGSSAEEQGVKIGWKIKAINGNPTAGKEIKAFIQEIADLVSALPDKGAPVSPTLLCGYALGY